VPASGRLVALEGGEGAGKSTQALRLARSMNAVATREPGGTATGEQIREVLLARRGAKLGDRTELLLMLAARAQHLEERIEPLLAAGTDVVVDRFSASTIAYQGYGRGLPLGEVMAACAIASTGRVPDLNILIDLDPAIGLSRTQGRHRGDGRDAERLGPFDRIEVEGLAFHERVRAGFIAQVASDSDHWALVDGSRSQDEVAAAILGTVAERIGLR
jgi:dTMP kinase